jgi:cytochrome c553
MKTRLPIKLRLGPRHVVLLALVSCALLVWLPAQAQDAVQGQRLFEDTPNVSGISGLTGSCTSCHGTVANRRTKIAGDPLAEISQATASDRFRLAIATVAPMNQFDALNPQQVQDIAAYLADTPQRSVDRLDFDATAVNVASPAQFVDLGNSVATTQALHVVSVRVEGAQASRFTRSADTCDLQSVAPAGSCRVTLSYAGLDTALASASLVFTLRQGTAATEFTRVVALSGVVSATPPAPPGAAPADSGGGALGMSWLVGLAIAVALLTAPRFRRTRCKRRATTSSSSHPPQGNP